MSISTFEKSLFQVIKGVHTIEEFSERIVRPAVIETLELVAEMYGLNGTALRENILERVVLKHARSISEEPKCKAITYRGKKCTNNAILDGYCQLHSRQQIKPKRKNVAKRGECDDIATKCARIFTSVGKIGVASRLPSTVSPSSDCTPSPSAP